jgi:hypothetical protein
MMAMPADRQQYASLPIEDDENFLGGDMNYFPQ